MKKIVVTLAGFAVLFAIPPTFAQETVLGAPTGPDVVYKEAPPVVPNPRKEAYEAQQQEKRLQAERDAAAAKERLRIQEEKDAEAQAAKEKVVVRRYDPSVRDAITGKVISKGNVTGDEIIKVQRYNPDARDAISGNVVNKDQNDKKRQTQSDVLREKYKKRRDDMRLDGKLD